MATTARMRRIAADYEQIKKDFAGHKNIVVEPIGEEPPEKYHVTYYVNGIYLLPDGKIETLGKHEVEITLHADYPRYKPICKITTPIWHPNFKDGQICIGDIWGAGESLSDIIINIGDMIQYRTWNSYSPLNADAAKWAMDNQFLFPVGNAELHIAEPASEPEITSEPVSAPVLEDPAAAAAEPSQAAVPTNLIVNTASDAVIPNVAASTKPLEDELDFEITADELKDIEYVPTSAPAQPQASGKKNINFKTILTKGLLWALIGSLLGFVVSEFFDTDKMKPALAHLYGSSNLSNYYAYTLAADEEWDLGYKEFEKYCRQNHMDTDEADIVTWYNYIASEEATNHIEKYLEYDDMADDALEDAYYYDFDTTDDLGAAMRGVSRLSTAIWSACIAVFIGLFLGIGEGVYYGSKEQAIKYALIGAGISLVIGLISGYLAQAMYAALLDDESSLFATSLVRGLGWAIMGIGIGVGSGLIKPDGKRILFCGLGGLVGAFIGGFLFNFICKIISNDIVARALAIVIMGGLIGLGVGLLEQFAKQAWLKVIRGEFEGKEYLVFKGTTSIGNNSQNTIVLFKDKLVAPHHCDIIQDGSKYVVVDSGSELGIAVNGRKVSRQVLRQGDAIAIGNSVLVFNNK